jgi:hypothetical protein
MAGLSLDSRINAKRLYAVAKPSDAFRFPEVHDQGPCSFHAFDLPLTATSTPVWSVDMRSVQADFQSRYGTRPYGNGEWLHFISASYIISSKAISLTLS